jgi:transitional endoplasmic reticulum ATPase
LLFDTASRLAIERGGNPEELAIDLTDIQRAIKQIKPLAVQTGLSTIPNISWNDLGGLFEIKQEIFSSMMYPLKYPDVYKQFGIPQSSGIMLHGPPGTGKTMIAKAAANDASANFIAVKPSDIFGKYLGQSENNVRDLFARAATLAPCIIFFDEFESIGSIRGGEGGSANRGREVVITQLLVEMDGIENRAGVFLLAATNRLDAVDPAFLRPGRFDKRIYVGLPNRKERASILEVAITSIRSNGVQIGWPNLKELARQTDGFSAADLTMLVREAASLAAHQMIERMDQSGVQLQPQIDAANFAQALRKLRPSSEIRQGSPSRQASTSAGPGYYM